MRRRTCCVPLVILLTMGAASIGPAAGADMAAQGRPTPTTIGTPRPGSGGGPSAHGALQGLGVPGERERNPSVNEAWYYQQRAAPFEHVPHGALLRARQELEARVQSGAMRRAGLGSPGPAGDTVVESAWTSIGPRPIVSEPPAVPFAGNPGFGQPTGSGPMPNAGRVTSLAVHPSNPSIVYLGAANGGVWKTTDAGAAWLPTTDSQPSQAIGALAIDPASPNIVYAGLGAQDSSGGSYFGFGILKSTDAGVNWALLNDPIFSRQRIGRIAVDPSNGSTVYAATTAGLAKSADGGATWTVACLAAECWVSDVVIEPSGVAGAPSTVYAAHGDPNGAPGNGIWTSTTNLAHTNANWTKLPGSGGNLFPTGAVGIGPGRIKLAVTRGMAPTTMYAAVHRVENDGLLGVWKTSDGGTTWRQTVAHPEAGLPVDSPSICRQCQYNLGVNVYPTDPNVVYVLATEVFRSTDGGASWSNVSKSHSGTPTWLHANQHALEFIPFPANPSSFYVGNDGGVYRSTDAGASFANLNQSLAITQFYRGAAHPTNPGVALGGSQESGVLLYEGTLGWHRALGGAGGYAAVDPQHPNFVFMTLQDLFIARSVDGGRGFVGQSNYPIPCASIDPSCVNGEPRQPIAPLVMDPGNPQTMYAGTNRLYRSPDSGANWFARSLDLSRGTSRTSISAIGAARTNPDVVYVGTGSSTSGAARVWVTANGGALFTDVTAGLPDRFVTSIAVHPHDANTAFVGLSGFDAEHLWKTTNAGANWTHLSSTLPNAPVNAIVVDRITGDRLYVATDVGVFKSSDGGASWGVLDAGLPNVVVNDLVLNAAGTRLFAFTEGRGAYAANRSGGGFPGPPLTRTPSPITSPTCGSFSTQAAGALAMGSGTQTAQLATPGPGGALDQARMTATPELALPSRRAAPADGPRSRPSAPGVGGRPIQAVAGPPGSDVQAASGPGWTTIACETFEGEWPTGRWSTGAGWPNVRDVCWATNNFQVYRSGRSAWHSNGCSEGIPNDPNNFFAYPFEDSFMVYGPFSLADATAAEVHFRLWYQINGQIVGGQPQGDAFYVLAFTPETAATGYFYVGNSTSAEPPTTDGWQSVAFDLANVHALGSLLGRPEVYVAWAFLSDFAGTPSLNGAFVDDVLIQKRTGATPSPTITTVGGRAFTLQSGETPSSSLSRAGRGGGALGSGAGVRVLSWEAGTQTSALLLRYSGLDGFSFLPSLASPIPPGVGSVLDTSPATDPCYALVSFQGVLPTPDVRALSDLLCIYTNTATGAQAPSAFRVRLNESSHVTLSWVAPGPQDRYELTASRFDGSGLRILPLDGSLTTFSEDIGARPTCYRLVALDGLSHLGGTDVLCASPGLADFP